MGDDFKDQFRAAKAARTTGKLTKDQLKALKAQKAAAAAAQKQDTTPIGRDVDTKSMPPPPPRPTSVPPTATAPPPQQKPPSAPAPPAGARSYHPDSQGTRINDGGGITSAGILQSEPSVNKQTGPLHPPTTTNNNNNVSLTESNALPTGFFEPPVVAQGGQGSTGGGLSVEAIVSKAAKSGEGSTGAALGSGGGGGGMRSGSAGGFQGDFLNATSQLSAMMETDPSLAAPAGSRAIGGDNGFQQHHQQQQQQNSAQNMNTVEGGGTSKMQQHVPNGFFDSGVVASTLGGTKASIAAAAASKDVEMDKEFAEFMKEVDVDATEAENRGNDVGKEGGGDEGEEEDDEDARRARDDFEQFVRMERLREVKEAAAASDKLKASGASGRGTTEFMTALEEKPASALEIAGVVADDVLPPPKLVLPRKRKVAETVALLEKQDSDDDADGGSGSGDEDSTGMVDWRAKKSMAK